MNTDNSAARQRYEAASYIIAGLSLFLVMKLNLLPALIAGLLVYELVHGLAQMLRKCGRFMTTARWPGRWWSA